MRDAASLPRIVRRRSAVHGHGVFAAETIAKNTRIIDYAGELLRNGEECEAREARYLSRGSSTTRARRTAGSRSSTRRSGFAPPGRSAAARN
jgi:SET domain-containing protein